jgi:YHS domain-containing protein
MKPTFIRCEFCKAEITSEACKLAAHRTVIEGREYVFCCAKCADRYEQRQKKKAK